MLNRLNLSKKLDERGDLTNQIRAEMQDAFFSSIMEDIIDKVDDKIEETIARAVLGRVENAIHFGLGSRWRAR